MRDSGFAKFKEANIECLAGILQQAYDMGFAAGKLQGDSEVKEKIMAALSSSGVIGDHSVPDTVDQPLGQEASETFEDLLGGGLPDSKLPETPLVPGADERNEEGRATDEISARKRAPRGLPKALIDRVLFERDLLAVTPQEILDEAKTQHEKMISVSTIRSVLRKDKSKYGHYIETNGMWSLSEDYKAVLETKRAKGEA